MHQAFIETDFHTRAGFDRDGDDYKDIVERSSLTHPLGRVGQTEDCVNAVAFLASESSSFLTGVLLPVDGGKSKKAPGL